MKIALFDLDGTLSDPSHREHLVRCEKPDWEEFFRQAKFDPPNQKIVNLCNTLYSHYEIMIVTGRPDSIRKETQEWLKINQVKYDGLTMRQEGNHKPDSEIKKDVLDSLIEVYGKDAIEFAIEDRQSVVDMWRENGIVCLQCAEGDF